MNRLAIPFHRRREERIALGHALRSPPMIGRPCDPAFRYPFPYPFGHAVDRDVSVSPSVPVLLVRCRPTNVSRFVRPFVVDAVDRMLRGRSTSYVGKEVFKRFSPSVAHGDPARPVVSEISMVRVVTTRDHRTPCSIFRGRRGFAVGRFPVSTRGFTELRAKFAAKASARLRSTTIEHLGKNDRLVPAFTTTSPTRALVRRLVSCEDCQTSNNLPLKVVQSHGPIDAQNWIGDKWQIPA